MATEFKLGWNKTVYSVLCLKTISVIPGASVGGSVGSLEHVFLDLINNLGNMLTTG